MQKVGKRAFISAVLLGALFSQSAMAEDLPRGASIAHTGKYYINRGYCSYTFILDNGNMGAFEELEIHLNHRDFVGRSMGQSVLTVEAFGDSNATRRQEAFLDLECEAAEGLHEFEVVKVVEKVNGKHKELPLHLFTGHNPQLAQVSVAASPGHEAIHPAFLGRWVTHPELCQTSEIMDDSQYILTFGGNMARFNGWQFVRTETFMDLNNSNGESVNTAESLGGRVSFYQFSPDYSEVYGTEENYYEIDAEGRLVIGGGADGFKLKKCH